MPYAFDIDAALTDANDPDSDTFTQVYGLFEQVDRTHSRRTIEESYPAKGGIELAFGELGSRWTSVTIGVQPSTGALTFEYTPAGRNAWKSKESALAAIFKPYVHNPEADAAKERGRDVKGLAQVMKPGEEGLDVGKQYLPPGVPANIASFLTGEKGSVKQQMTTLKAKATGKGRRKTRNGKSKTRASRRTSLARMTRRR